MYLGQGFNPKSYRPMDRSLSLSLSLYIYIYIYIYEYTMVLIVGNGHGDTSTGMAVCILHIANSIGKCMNPIILPPVMSK